MRQHIYTADGSKTVEISDPTSEETQAEADRIQEYIEKTNREIRNNLLLESDWTQGADSPLTDTKKAEWATYRAALRNLPTDEDWPEPEWPTKPS